jgi:hypothetical protein
MYQIHDIYSPEGFHINLRSLQYAAHRGSKNSFAAMTSVFVLKATTLMRCHFSIRVSEY